MWSDEIWKQPNPTRIEPLLLYLRCCKNILLCRKSEGIPKHGRDLKTYVIHTERKPQNGGLEGTRKLHHCVWINSLLLCIHKSIDSYHVWQWPMSIYLQFLWVTHFAMSYNFLMWIIGLLTPSLFVSNTNLGKTLLMPITISKIVHFMYMLLPWRKTHLNIESIFLIFFFYWKWN